MTKFYKVSAFFLFILCIQAAFSADPPVRLATDLVEHTDRIYWNGYASNILPKDIKGVIENIQTVLIGTSNPSLSWVIPDGRPDIKQTAYRILVASDAGMLEKDSADLWDSGKVLSSRSVSVNYNGKALKPGNYYFWKVKIWNNLNEESSFSRPKWFCTANELVEYSTPEVPLVKNDEAPVIVTNTDREAFIDFGKAAFGTIRLNYNSDKIYDTLILHLGERLADNGRINRRPGGTLRYRRIALPVTRGINTYRVKIEPDRRNTGPSAVLMPDYTGEVLPFRYLEIEGACRQFDKNSVVRESVYFPFDDNASYFSSSDTILNQVWDLCQYSIKATSFTGYYIDGDRERIPYEADALINQLSHYAVDREYSMTRRSLDFLMKHPTWPTEWHLQIPMIAWYDWLYTGDDRVLRMYYTAMQPKTLEALREQNGLISTVTGKQTDEFLKSIGIGEGSLDSKIRDIVDWPQSGLAGPENKNGGETDGYIFTDYNTVANAFHVNSLNIMSGIAKTLGKDNDSRRYSEMAEHTGKQLLSLLRDKNTGLFVDGSDTDHSSLHANMFPLAFGILDKKLTDKERNRIIEFIRSRGMACSVYGAQFLLDAIYEVGDPEYGLQLLTSVSDRSWYNMIRLGSTITLEAWDNKYKPNLDWNHAWGAAPANIIVRKLMGITPLEPGFSRIRIAPAPAGLREAELVTPSLYGDIRAKFISEPGVSFTLEVEIPANTEAEIAIPVNSKVFTAIIDGVQIRKPVVQNGRVVINCGSGRKKIIVTEGVSPVKKDVLRVMSYNIRNARGMDDKTDYGRIASVINGISPRVVALQELDSMTTRSGRTDVLKELAHLTGMYGTYGAAIDYQGGKYGVGILSKERPLNIISIPLPGREEARCVLIAEFKDYILCSTHFSLTEEDRISSIKLISEAVKDFKKPVIIAGDFNDTPGTKVIDMLKKDFNILSDTGQKTYPSIDSEVCIDYIAMHRKYSGNYKTLNSVVEKESIASDHAPLYVDIL